MKAAGNRSCVVLVLIAVCLCAPNSIAAANPSGHDTAGVRFQLPQFTFVHGMGDRFVLGTEQAFQVEIFNHHLVQAGFVWGRYGQLDYYGGGIGYAYSWEFLRGLMRFDLGFLVGFYYFTRNEECTDSDLAQSMFIMVQPTFHVGSKYIYFSIGPRLVAGLGVAGGFVAGLTVRLVGSTKWRDL